MTAPLNDRDRNRVLPLCLSLPRRDNRPRPPLPFAPSFALQCTWQADPAVRVRALAAELAHGGRQEVRWTAECNALHAQVSR
jgi:hypothetical protein